MFSIELKQTCVCVLCARTSKSYLTTAKVTVLEKEIDRFRGQSRSKNIGRASLFLSESCSKSQLKALGSFCCKCEDTSSCLSFSLDHNHHLMKRRLMYICMRSSSLSFLFN